MKCRACWADKAYVRQLTGWRKTLHSALFFVPLKCHHCYHKFSVFWPLTVGKQTTPPAFKVAPGTHQPGLVYANRKANLPAQSAGDRRKAA
jgi:hypothetical protein